MASRVVVSRCWWSFRVAIVVCCSVALSSSAFCDEESAADIFAAFVARQNSDCPVTGTFTIETQRDAATLAAVAIRAKKDAAAQCLTVNDPTLPRETWRCRWSYCKDRELLETLDETSLWESFYSTKEQLLSGVERGNFNIMRPRLPSIMRPASFYFYIGSKRWSDFPVDKNITFGEIDEPGTIGLVIREGKLHILLTIDAVSRRLKRAEFKFDGKLVGTQEVESYIEGGDGQAFPASATLTLYFRDKIIKVDKLTTESIAFPASPAEDEAAFAMELPAGTSVYNLFMKRRLLSKPTLATEVLSEDGFE